MTLASIPNITTYTYTPTGASATTFVRRVSGEFESWFSAGNAYVKDSVLAAGTVIIDVGGAVFDPLVVLAEFDTSTARATFKDLLYTSGTLANALGRSATVVFVKAREPDQNDGRYLLECTFEKYQ